MFIIVSCDRIMAPVMIGNSACGCAFFAQVVEASPMPEAFALLDAHASLWCELFDAAANGDRDAWRVLIETWRPLIGSIEVLLPMAVGTLDDWNFEVAAPRDRAAQRPQASHTRRRVNRCAVGLCRVWPFTRRCRSPAA
jgi:hypothetical protein